MAAWRESNPRTKRPPFSAGCCAPRFVMHFTPPCSSWLNLVERFFGLLTQHALQRGSHTSVPEIRRAIAEHIDAHNERGRPFKWIRSADEILAKVQRFGLRTQQAHRLQ